MSLKERDPNSAPLASLPRDVSSTSSLLSLIEAYRSQYASSDDHTSKAKRLDLDTFLVFLQNDCGYRSARELKVSDWTHAAIQRFVEVRLQRGEAPATVNRRLATVKHMGRVLAEQVRGFTNAAREVRGPRVDPLKPKGLSNEELSEVRGTALEREGKRRSFQTFRDRVLFEFLVDTGLRADEVRLLRFGQLDEKQEWIRDVRTKGKKFRRVYVTSRFRPLLIEYLAAREVVLKKWYAKLPPSEARALPVFLSVHGAVPGNPDSFLMSPKTIWRAVRRLSSGRRLHPHLLRHSFALDLLESSSDVRLVAQALGHSDVRVTMRYTQRRDEEVAEALEESRKSK